MKFAIYLNICAIVMSPLVILLAYFQLLPSHIILNITIGIFFMYASICEMILYLKMVDGDSRLRIFLNHKYLSPLIFGLYWSVAGISLGTFFSTESSNAFFIVLSNVFFFFSGVLAFYWLRFMIRILLKYGVIRKFF